MKSVSTLGALAIAALCAAAPPTAGAEIRTGAGLCLDAHAPDMGKNGGRVQAWVCNGSPQQTWTYDPAARAVRISSGLCLDVHAPDMTTNGGRVQVWVCNGSPQQQWTPLANTSLRNAGGFCLDVHGADQTRMGARVQVWQCNGSQQQRFVFGTGGGVPAIGQGPSPVVPPPVAVAPVEPPPLALDQVNDFRQWRVENTDAVLGNEPYELHNMRRRALNLTSQLGHKHWDRRLDTDLEDIGWMGSSGGHFIFVRTNTSDRRPIAPDEVVALYNTKIKKYFWGCWVLSQGWTNRYVAGWSSSPYYAWMVRHRVGADFALYNFKRGEYLVLVGTSNAANLGYATSQPPFQCK